MVGWGRNLSSPPRLYNFAFPGATAEDDLPGQFSLFKEGLCDASLDGESTTYCAWSQHDATKNEAHRCLAIVFYLGINDCGRTCSDDLEPIVEAIFDVLHSLYTKFFARNFVFIDVPPIDRSPTGMFFPSDLS